MTNQHDQKTNGLTLKKTLKKYNTKEYKYWVKNVKDRDNDAVFYAGQTSTGTHHVFSFKNFIPLRLEPDNGIT